MKRAALYVRVSSQGQVRDGYSLQFQEDILREFCQREGLAIAEVYRDGGQSGASTKRKDLIRLIEDARQNRFEIVLIFRVDRFSRDPVDLLALVRELELRSIKLRSVTEAVDASDPAGELMLTILGAIGKFVRQNIIQNAMLGKTKRAETGRYTGGKVPFGYCVDESGVYIPDETVWWNGRTKAEVVRLVFSTYIRLATQEGGGCLRTARQLANMEIPGPKEAWGHASVYQMLTNPCYTGDFAYNKRSHQLHKQSKSHDKDEWLVVKDAHEPIIDRQTFDQVQSLLKRNKTYGGRPAASDGQSADLLTGYLRCGECGGALSPRAPGKNQKYLYYSCLSRYSEKRKREGNVCQDFPWIRADQLADLIWGALMETAADRERIAELKERMNAGVSPELGETQAEIQRLERRRHALEQQASAVTTTYFDGKMPEYVWQGQLERIERERVGIVTRIEEAQRKLAELQANTPVLASEEEIQDYLQEVLSECTTMEERREALSILVGPRGIRVMKDGTVDFDLKIPVAIASQLHTVKLSAPSRQAL